MYLTFTSVLLTNTLHNRIKADHCWIHAVVDWSQYGHFLSFGRTCRHWLCHSRRTVRPVVNQVIRYGKVVRPTLGIHAAHDRIKRSVENQLWMESLLQKTLIAVLRLLRACMVYCSDSREKETSITSSLFVFPTSKLAIKTLKPHPDKVAMIPKESPSNKLKTVMKSPNLLFSPWFRIICKKWLVATPQRQRELTDSSQSNGRG